MLITHVMTDGEWQPAPPWARFHYPVPGGAPELAAAVGAYCPLPSHPSGRPGPGPQLYRVGDPSWASNGGLPPAPAIEDEAEPAPLLRDDALYLTDNGEVLHGRCCGASARYTGRDLSGQAVMPVTPAVHAEALQLHGRQLSCEACTPRERTAIR